MAKGCAIGSSAWEDFRIEAEEFRELDDERIFVLDRCSGSGKTSGLDVARMGSEGIGLFHVRDGKVTQVRPLLRPRPRLRRPRPGGVGDVAGERGPHPAGTTRDTPAMSAVSASMTSGFVEAILARDFSRARGFLHPDIDFRAMTPTRVWEADGPAGVEDVLRAWFEHPDRAVERVEPTEPASVEDTLRVGWRVHGTDADGPFIYEQQAYVRERRADRLAARDVQRSAPFGDRVARSEVQPGLVVPITRPR